MSDHTTHDSDFYSLKYESYYSSDERSNNSSGSDWSPPQRRAPSHKRKLMYTHSSGSDHSSTSRKCKLNSVLLSGNEHIYPFKRLKTEAEVPLSNSFAEYSKFFSSAIKASNKCDEMLRQIIRTAYQFTRHSHRQKLTVKDLEKAFKIHCIDMKPEDYSLVDIDMNNIDSVESGIESQPFTCSGMWLRKP